MRRRSLIEGRRATRTFTANAPPSVRRAGVSRSAASVQAGGAEVGLLATPAPGPGRRRCPPVLDAAIAPDADRTRPHHDEASDDPVASRVEVEAAGEAPETTLESQPVGQHLAQ